MIIPDSAISSTVLQATIYQFIWKFQNRNSTVYGTFIDILMIAGQVFQSAVEIVIVLKMHSSDSVNRIEKNMGEFQNAIQSEIERVSKAIDADWIHHILAVTNSIKTLIFTTTFTLRNMQNNKLGGRVFSNLKSIWKFHSTNIQNMIFNCNEEIKVDQVSPKYREILDLLIELHKSRDCPLDIKIQLILVNSIRSCANGDIGFLDWVAEFVQHVKSGGPSMKPLYRYCNNLTKLCQEMVPVKCKS